MPHSNFHPELEISDDGSVIKIGGPIEAEDDDDKLAGISISALVTQAPASARQPAGGRSRARPARAASSSVMPSSHSPRRLGVHGRGAGRPFREDWAFASAEMIEKAEDGAIERYTWSQWVSLRRP